MRHSSSTPVLTLACWLLLGVGALALTAIPTRDAGSISAEEQAMLDRIERKLARYTIKSSRTEPYAKPAEAASFFMNQRQPIGGGELPIEQLQASLA
ncbi:MAG: hypothetical protein AAFX05_10325, partial [Planctomycetota bacterium]